jgi:methionyl-tRNA formyltransferase
MRDFGAASNSRPARGSPLIKVLEDVCLLAADTARARAYLDLMLKAGLRPCHAVILTACVGPAPSVDRAGSALYDNSTPLAEALARAGVTVTAVDSGDINDSRVCSALSALSASIVIFAGPSGALVRAPLFATSKRFLHVHPGRLPEYRGSTPMYYSLLAEGKLSASAIFLEPEIDVGPLVAVKDFPSPEDRSTIDKEYDPWMRASLLVEVLKKYLAEGKLACSPQTKSGEMTFFVIHPLLKHLAILASPDKALASQANGHRGLTT